MKRKDLRKDGIQFTLTLVWQKDQYVCPVQGEIEDLILHETGSSDRTYFDPVYLANGIALQFSKDLQAWTFRRRTLPEDEAAMAVIHEAAQHLKKRDSQHCSRLVEKLVQKMGS